jgi:hypothetical protein
MCDLRRIVALLSLALLIASAAFSQAVNGTIVGTVTDASGAVMPGVKITLTEVNTKMVHTRETNASGDFSFPDLPPGAYDVAAEMTGFKKEVKSGTVLEANNSPRVDLKLQTGDVTQTVEVSAIAATLQTERADTGRTMDSPPLRCSDLQSERHWAKPPAPPVPDTSDASQQVTHIYLAHIALP